MQKKDSETLIKEKEIIIRHLQSRIKCFEEDLNEKDDLIDKLNDQISKLQTCIGLQKQAHPKSAYDPNSNQSFCIQHQNAVLISQSYYPQLEVKEPDSKSFAQIWNLLDKYVQIGKRRFGPAKIIDQFKKLGKVPSNLWQQHELDSTVKLLLEDIESSSVLAQKPVNIRRKGYSPRKSLIQSTNSYCIIKQSSQIHPISPRLLTSSKAQGGSKSSLNSDDRRVDLNELKIPGLQFKHNSSFNCRTTQVSETIENSPR